MVSLSSNSLMRRRHSGQSVSCCFSPVRNEAGTGAFGELANLSLLPFILKILTMAVRI